MARYDKYDPVSGGFRAPLAANQAAVGILAVGLDANGRVVPGAGVSGVKGVLSLTKALNAGDIVDVMTDGEMVEMAGMVAGTTYFGATIDGAVSTATGVYLGHTVEATRLIVRVKPSGGAA